MVANVYFTNDDEYILVRDTLEDMFTALQIFINDGFEIEEVTIRKNNWRDYYDSPVGINNQ